MKQEKEVIFEREGDPLAEAAKLDDSLPPRGADGHIDRAEEEWAREPYVFERLVQDAGTKMLDVKRDVRIFGQGRASYLGGSRAAIAFVPSPGRTARPAVRSSAESGQTGRGPIYPRRQR